LAAAPGARATPTASASATATVAVAAGFFAGERSAVDRPDADVAGFDDDAGADAAGASFFVRRSLSAARGLGDEV